MGEREIVALWVREVGGLLGDFVADMVVVLEKRVLMGGLGIPGMRWVYNW